MEISLIFCLAQSTLPSEFEQLNGLWRVAKLLEPLGFPIEKWYPPASTPARSILTEAFDRSGPTVAAVEILRSQRQEVEIPGLRLTGVWNGPEGDSGIVLNSSLSVMGDNPICDFRFGADDVPSLCEKQSMLSLVLGLLDIWPASIIEVGPYRYMYMQQRVFPKRPGAGWMLYLAREITPSQLPEAQELIPVMEGGRQKGTIIVSIANEAFCADNPEHVTIANAIEVRLVDQGLLPRYADL